MGDWPFVGRDDELHTIRGCLLQGDALGAVISGEAGIGKTRLAREIVARLADEGHTTEWLAATESLASIPFGAVAPLLPAGQAPADHAVSVLADAALRIHERLVLAVDDAHLLDPQSAGLIGHLATRRLAFVIATCRAGATVPDTITMLWKDGGAPWLDLPRLPPPAVDQLLDHALNGELDGVARRRLREVAAGNPLALRELVSAGGNRPQGAIRHLVEERLRPLDPGERHVLELLACGAPLPLSLLAQLADPGSIDLVEAHGLAVSERTGNRVEVRLAHPLYGEVLRDGLPAGRTRQLYWRLAGALLATPLRRRDDQLRAALWQMEGGAVVRADVVRTGAREAVNRGDLALAERLARAARDAEPSPGADALLAEVLEYRGRSAEAFAVLREEPPEGEDLAGWALVRAETAYWGGGDAVAAERALALVDGRPGEDLAQGIRTWILLFDARGHDVLEVADRLLASDATSAQAIIWATAAATAAAGFLGRPEDAARYHERGLTVAEERKAELPWGAVELGVARCLAFLAMGDLRAAWTVADDGYRSVLSGDSPMMSAGYLGFRGLVECAQGRTAAAVASLKETLIALEGRDTLRLTRVFLAGLATATALGGDAAGARDWLDQADQAASGANRLFAPWIANAAAWTLAAEGRLSDAIDAARYAADLATGIGLPTVAARARFDVLRLGGRAPESADEPWASAAYGITQLDGPALSTAADAFDRLGQHLLAAEIATCAVRAHRHAGLAGRAAMARERAAILRARCAGAVTPLLAHEQISHVLSRREREVALLAVRLSSRSIAERLGLSIATVNNNLARAYGKLGVTSRSQLAALLDDGQAL